MATLEDILEEYLEYCAFEKNLDKKTLKAYRIDLKQFILFISAKTLPVSTENIAQYIEKINEEYQPATVRRKIVSVKAFFRYLEQKELIEISPCYKMNIHIGQPQCKRIVISADVVEQLLATMYSEMENAKSGLSYRKAIQSIAIVELLVATGMCISEICALKQSDVDIENKCIFIHGKGAKKRILQIENKRVMDALILYQKIYADKMKDTECFFVNRLSKALSEQSVRYMINFYTKKAGIEMHITPQMFRNTFAVSCLNSDMDIRNVCKILGHSSVQVTEQYESALKHDNENKLDNESVMKLENNNPTETEILMFKYLGLYLVDKNEHMLRYAPAHTDSSYRRKKFPIQIDVDTEDIEWDSVITFDKLSETVSINSFYDIDAMALILARMDELGFKRLLM